MDYDKDSMGHSDTGVEFENERESMYGAATKANSALAEDMANYSQKDASAPSEASDPSLRENSRGTVSTPSRSSNMGENVRS